MNNTITLTDSSPYDRYMSRKASKTQIANELGISRNTLTRLFNEYEKTLSGGDQ